MRRYCKTSYTNIWLFVVLTALANVCVAGSRQQSIAVDASVGSLNVGHAIDYLEDPTGLLSLDDVWALSPAAWTNNQLPMIDFRYTESVYWFRLILQREQGDWSRWLLNVKYPYLDMVDVYNFTDDGEVTHYTVGDQRRASEKPIVSNKLVFPVEFRDGDKLVSFIRVETDSGLKLPIYLWQDHDFFKQQRNDNIVTFGVYGALLALFIFSFVLFLIAQDVFLLYYMLFVFMQFFMVFLGENLGSVYLFSERPYLNNVVFMFLNPADCFLLVYIVYRFLELREHAPILSFVSKCLMLASALMFMASLFLSYRAIVVPNLYLLMVGHMFAVISSAYMWIKGKPFARYFFIGWAAYLVMSTIFVLGVLAIIPFSDKMFGLSHIGIFFQAIFMTMAFGDKIRYQKIRQIQMQSDQARLKAESQAKSNFMAKMSHEIRTPMNGVLGMSELMDDHLTDPVAKHYNKVIQSSGKMLLTIINDILDYSKIEAGKMVLEHVAYDIRLLADQTLEIFRLAAVEKSVELFVDVDATVPGTIIGDPIRVKQIMVNLFGNAMKFTAQGSIRLKIESVITASHQSQLKISVIDSGCGIAESVQAQLFNSFTQADRSVARKYGGTGLGLTIAKELAVLMGGDIGVVSEEGCGATFWVTIDCQEAAEDQGIAVEQAVESVLTHSVRLLVAEDNQVNQMVIKGMLKKLDCIPVMVANGEEALQYYIEHANDIDMILMDCEMPILDGLQATQKIRDWEQENLLSAIPIVAVTAHILPTTVDACFEAGMDDYLSKPVNSKLLKEKLQRFGGPAGKLDLISG